MHHATTGHDSRDHDEIDERVWNDLQQRVPRAQVHAVTAQIYARYGDARIRVFIPIIVRREARGVLEQSLSLAPETAPPSDLASPGAEFAQSRAQSTAPSILPTIVRGALANRLARYFHSRWTARSRADALEIVS